MYMHVFVFKWKPVATEQQKAKAAQEIAAFAGNIPGLLETYAGTNRSTRGQGHEFGGVMKFSDKAAYEAYGTHPLHQALLEWPMPLIEPLELDFEA